ncbi:MAG TPA: phenylalanine--tRNA ligase subunit beta, partial [Gammaproteobacteria bacterium]|nr:phenylalanine--tRNA ligase subunit beta [Gammaproteobacteria bacterium]
ARELHALTKATLHPVRIESIAPHKDDTLTIHIEDEKACPRYCGRIIKNIDCSKPSPDWLKEKLRRSGIRSINPIVDIMNYVMLELGQPMHAFDLDKIDHAIYVRLSQEGEQLTLLDGKEVKIHPNTLTIADSNKPLALAGIMGGEESAVTDTTKNIFLESAFFHPEAIVGKARSFGLHTDSSARFERGVDPNLQDSAIERATQWILDICGGEPCPITDIKTQALQSHKSIKLAISKAKKLIGMDLEEKSIIQDLERLGCVVSNNSEDVWDVKIPSFRFDLSIPEDLVEEIARCGGYDAITASLPKAQLKPNYEKKPFSEKRLKHALIDFGYHEAITYSFVDPKLQNLLFPEVEKIALSNPIASDLSQMRISLWPGLLKALQYNYHRQQNNIFLFETGLVFQETAAGLVQEPKLGGVCLGSLLPEHWQEKPKAIDFYAIKGHLETLWGLNRKDLAKLKWEATKHPALHPGQACHLVYKDKVVGILGALHPDIEKHLDIKAPIFVFELKLKALLRSKSIRFKKPSVFPSIRRDLSMVIDANIPYEKLSNWIHGEAGNLLKKLVLFDIYQGKNIKPGCKSVALGFIWQDPNRTLVDKEIDDIMQDLIQGLEQQFGAQLRE